MAEDKKAPVKRQVPPPRRDDGSHRLKRTWAVGTFVHWKKSPQPPTTSRSTEDFDIGA